MHGFDLIKKLNHSGKGLEIMAYEYIHKLILLPNLVVLIIIKIIIPLLLITIMLLLLLLLLSFILIKTDELNTKEQLT